MKSNVFGQQEWSTQSQSFHFGSNGCCCCCCSNDHDGIDHQPNHHFPVLVKVNERGSRWQKLQSKTKAKSKWTLCLIKPLPHFRDWNNPLKMKETRWTLDQAHDQIQSDSKHIHDDDDDDGQLEYNVQVFANTIKQERRFHGLRMCGREKQRKKVCKCYGQF